MTREQLDRYIQQELGNWGANTTRILQENIKRNKLVLSEDLLKSFRHQVITTMGGKLQSLLLSFNEYGRMKEMKGLTYTKMPPVEAMEEFVRKVGLAKFKYVPGYNRGKIPSEDIAVKRIAWGISKSMYSNYKGKPRKWFAKAFYAEVNHLISELVIAHQEHVASTMKENLQNLNQ
jgi:hypothetical protein